MAGAAATSKEPRNTKLLQQNLDACRPVLEPIWVVFIFLAIGAVCIPIGAICLAYGLRAVEVSARYDQSCIPDMDNAARQSYLWQHAGDEARLSCRVVLNITDDMPSPLFLFYEIRGLYQNHRRYVKSRSDEQLVNRSSDAFPDQCEPQDAYAGLPLTTPPIDPCGLAAWSFFNDSYTLRLVRGGGATSANIAVSAEGIAFPPDVKHLFANYTAQNFNPELNEYRGGGNLSVPVQQDERFVNWMRLAPLPSFRKLWGKVEGLDLRAGDQVVVNVVNRYNTYAFDGRKSLVLSTSTWLGGRNPFLGVAFLVTGSLGVLLGLVFLVAHLVRPRRFGDVRALGVGPGDGPGT